MVLLKDEIKFDPGFIIHLQAFIPTIEDIYSKILRFKNFGQKRNMFKNYFPRLKTLTNNYIGFYLGCILWAIILQQEKNQPIIGNLCYGGTFDEDTLYEVDFVKSFAQQLPKDVKYYLNESYTIEDYSFKILDLYREFLSLNEGFVSCQNTDDIKLPMQIKNLTDDKIENIYKMVKLVVEDGQFERFFELKDYIL